jgi:cytochrome c biogenesis protein CcmG/thiol:disulfide interchange protein DsbE
MIRFWFKAVILAVLAVLVLLIANSAEYPRPADKDLHADDVRGKPCPPLYVEQWLAPAPDVTGKIVLIDFWATWCPTCLESISELNWFQKEFKDKLVVIGITDEPAQTAVDFMRDHEMDYTVAVDTSARMARAINLQGIPHVLIVSTDGIVRWQGMPFDPADPLTDKIIRQIINADQHAAPNAPHPPPPSHAPAS